MHKYDILKPLSSLNGVGQTLLSSLKKILPNVRIADLLFHFPIRTVPRYLISDLSKISDGDLLTIKVNIISYKANYNKKSPFCVIATTEDLEEIYIDFFHLKKEYISKLLPLNTSQIISGKCKIYKGKIHFMHPDYILTPDKYSDFIEAIYPLTQGLHLKSIRKFIAQSLKLIEDFPEWQDATHRKQQNFVSFKDSITNIHLPKSDDDFAIESKNVKRLAYDEFLATQVALQIIRKNSKINTKSGKIIELNAASLKNFTDSLPFKLTKSQNDVISEILADQKKPERMSRLIQGDVGCGKTVVAAAAILNTINSGYQVALMVPTAVLGTQHYKFFNDFLRNISTILLTGNIKGKKRDTLLSDIESGNAQLIIGTHALFYDKIKFKNLGLVVIDEQHRFGVKQRMKLIEKGFACDFLLMSATPIPRTLAATIYGDMEVSCITEKPQNRKPIDTRVISLHKIDNVITAITRAILKKEKIYWICPLVEESNILTLSAVEDRFTKFQKIFGEKDVAMIHGKMTPDKKDLILKNFLDGKYKILIATTVIEVGINIPDATIMVIEHANQFGLAQLHQLRGRVGRGEKQGVCILLYNNKQISDTSLSRLKVMSESNDGFKIAEKDLQIRGSGEILGVKQSGLPNFKIAQLRYHYDLLKTATNDAKLLLHNDPDLVSPRGKAVRILLEIFEYNSKIIKKIAA